MNIPSSNSFKIITLSLSIVPVTTSAQIPRCPFYFIYILGDGSTDIGNAAVRLNPFGSTLRDRANRLPYGITYPGRPTGRWSDGLNDADYTARVLGLPYLIEFLSPSITTSMYDGVVFSVEGSTVLNNSFFVSRRISLPPQPNIPLSVQVNWYGDFINSNICTNPRECSNRQPSNSLVALKYLEANDIRYALLQGRSIQEVTTFVPLMVQSQIDAARTMIELGATQLVYVLAYPLGCFPDILTALFTSDPTAYDGLGCLRAVNNLIMSYNAALQAAFDALRAEDPSIIIIGADLYNVTRAYIAQKSTRGPTGNIALKTCCRIGGRYNFNSQRLCGSPNVPVCPNPDNYIFWDGVHLTQEAYRQTVNKIAQTAGLELLNCTAS